MIALLIVRNFVLVCLLIEVYKICKTYSGYLTLRYVDLFFNQVTGLHILLQKLVLSVSEDGTLRVWEMTAAAAARSAAARRRCTFHLHGQAASVAMTIDGQRVATVVRTEPVGKPVLFLLRSINL